MLARLLAESPALNGERAIVALVPPWAPGGLRPVAGGAAGASQASAWDAWTV